MNLHITHDNVFIDYVIQIAHELNVSEDRFVVYTFEEVEKLKHIKSSNVLFAKHNSARFKELTGDLKQYKNIFIHWLEGPAADFVNQIPNGINVIWCFWGGDGLELKHIQKKVFQPKSLKYFEQHNHNYLIDELNPKLVYQLLKKNYRNHRAHKNHLKAIGRVNNFAHYLEEDFEIVKAATSMRADFIPFHYAAVEDIVNVKSAVTTNGQKNILLGNSDTLSNNHFEAIDILQKVETGNARIYCPLSYEGGNYARDIEAYGKERLGSRFFPLLQMLPKQEYDSLLAGISCGIMNHNRSQALGNICTLLWQGARLYMSDNSSLYHFLKGNGCKVFSLKHDLISHSTYLSTALGEDDVNNNRQVLLKLFGRINQKKKIAAMLSL